MPVLPTDPTPDTLPAGNNSLLYTVFIATLAWAVAKLPAWSTLQDAWFHPRFLPWIVVTALISWFLVHYRPGRRLLLQASPSPSYVGLWGALSTPLVATWLWDQVLQRQSRLAPMIANVFSPLFLLMTVAYLLALLGQGRSPFSDRDFLIVFNALLLVVWGITVFSVIGRGEQSSRLLDLTNLALVAVTLLIDGIALAAILWRTAEYGITPNRITVTGANLLICLHLVWILVEYARTFRQAGCALVLRTSIARYLPVYTGWGLFVVLLPLLFGFA